MEVERKMHGSKQVLRYEDTCQFCGEKVTALARTVQRNMLRAIPGVGVAFIYQSRGTCEDHLQQILRFVRKRRNGTYIADRNKLREFSRRQYFIYIRQLSFWNGGDGFLHHFKLTSQVYGKKNKREPWMNIEKFGILWVKGSLDKNFRPGRKKPRACWLRPPKGDCCYQSHCTNKHRCKGSLFRMFVEETISSNWPHELTEAINIVNYRIALYLIPNIVYARAYMMPELNYNRR